MAAPRITSILAGMLGLGIVLQATFAGGFIGGRQTWLHWHQRVGDLLLLLPLVSLVIALALRRHHPERAEFVAVRVALVLLVVLVELTGHAGGNWLALHIPAAVTAMALVVRQGMTSMET